MDTETTGLDARIARLVQVGGLRIKQGALNPEERFESLVNPGVPIPKVATTIHGINDGMVATAPKFADIAAGLESFIGSSILVGHTIYYDLAVIDREYSLAGRKGRPDWRGLDVRMLARLASPSLADYSLDRLCDWLGIELKGRHTAMGDAEAAGRVFLALIPLLRDKNIRTLAEAQAASRALAEDESRTGTGVSAGAPAPAGSDERGALASTASPTATSCATS